MRAIWNNKVIAESDDITTIEGNVYFPLAALDRRYVVTSDLHTTCPWKGRASYLTLSVDGEINQDAAWYYPEPRAGAEAVANRVAFWRGVLIQP